MKTRHGETPLWVVALLDKNLSPVEFRVVSYILWRGGRNGSAYPGQSTIGRELGLTNEGVRKIIHRLAEGGWITVERPTHTGPGRGLGYHVTQPHNHPNSGLGEQPNSGLGVAGGNHPNGHTKNTPTAKPRHKGRTLSRTLRAEEARSEGRRQKPKSRASKRPPEQPFTPPTVEQVSDYAESRGNPIFDGQRFVAYYQERGWIKANGQPVRDWKGTVRAWIERDNQRRIERGEPPLDGYSQFGTHPATEEEIKKLEEAGVL